jgi:hypothetical protein
MSYTEDAFPSYDALPEYPAPKLDGALATQASGLLFKALEEDSAIAYDVRGGFAFVRKSELSTAPLDSLPTGGYRSSGDDVVLTVTLRLDGHRDDVKELVAFAAGERARAEAEARAQELGAIDAQVEELLKRRQKLEAEANPGPSPRDVARLRHSFSSPF